MIASYYVNPQGFIGSKVTIILKAGGTFNLFVKDANGDSIKGFDEEGIDINVSLGDIDCLFEL